MNNLIIGFHAMFYSKNYVRLKGSHTVLKNSFFLQNNVLSIICAMSIRKGSSRSQGLYKNHTFCTRGQFLTILKNALGIQFLTILENALGSIISHPRSRESPGGL
uniref:Uncharacterized protein n=1 Tax=Cacopsylla melanoneura TaxID=428564 RepID=A0A8D8XGA8_9HEMI